MTDLIKELKELNKQIVEKEKEIKPLEDYFLSKCDEVKSEHRSEVKVLELALNNKYKLSLDIIEKTTISCTDLCLNLEKDYKVCLLSDNIKENSIDELWFSYSPSRNRQFYSLVYYNRNRNKKFAARLVSFIYSNQEDYNEDFIETCKKCEEFISKVFNYV